MPFAMRLATTGCGVAVAVVPTTDKESAGKSQTSTPIGVTI